MFSVMKGHVIQFNIVIRSCVFNSFTDVNRRIRQTGTNRSWLLATVDITFLSIHCGLQSFENKRYVLSLDLFFNL